MSDDDAVICFLPCRKGSERVPRKNLRPFGPYANGLLEVKLRQLTAARRIDRIVLSTNDEEILDYAGRLGEARIMLHRRDDALASSATSTDDLVAHALDLIGAGHILWTHVTSPFVTAAVYDAVIDGYRAGLAEGYDSLMSTTIIHGFLWGQSGPLNYDRAVEKWPRTQTLAPVHEVNSAVFLAPSRVYDRLGDRIGQRPLLHGMDRIVGMDIDWEEDFRIAEALLAQGLARV